MLHTAFTFKIVQVLKHVYEDICKMKSLSSHTPLAPAAKVEKKLAAEFFWNEPSYKLHTNHRICGSYYRKTKAFFRFHILQVDLLTLDEIQIRP